MNSYRIVYWHKKQNGKADEKCRSIVPAANAAAALRQFFGAAGEKMKVEYKPAKDVANVNPPPFTGGQGYRAERIA